MHGYRTGKVMGNYLEVLGKDHKSINKVVRRCVEGNKKVPQEYLKRNRKLLEKYRFSVGKVLGIYFEGFGKVPSKYC